MSDISDALEAWREARRALDAAMPWTADWLRLRLIEADRHETYLALADKRTAEPAHETPRASGGIQGRPTAS